MKIAIPTTENNPTLSSAPNKLMGTAKAIVIYDTNLDKFEVFENIYLDKDDCHLSRDLKNLGVDAVVAFEVCSPCFDNLRHMGIDVWKDDGSATIREAYQKFVIGGLFLKTKPSTCHCPKHKTIMAEADTIAQD